MHVYRLSWYEGLIYNLYVYVLHTRVLSRLNWSFLEASNELWYLFVWYM